MRVLCLIAVALAFAAPATAQTVDEVASALATSDTYVGGGADGEELARTVAALQEGAAFFKAVVLPEAPPGGERAFARDLLASLGGSGRVAVYSPTGVGIASEVDPLSDVAVAESDAAEQLAGGSLAASVRAAGAALADSAGEPLLPGPVESGGGEEPAPAAPPSRAPGFGAGPLLLLLMVGAFFLLPLLFRRRMRRTAEQEDEQAATAAFGDGERKVRQAVDRAGNLILELSDRIDVPDVPAETRAAYREGARGFTEVHDQLEHADTRAELEEIYPRIVAVVWQLESARAALDGEPAPPRPEPEPLFPRLEEYEDVPSYSVFGASPFFTASALSALTLLGTQGIVFSSGRGAMGEEEFWELLEPQPHHTDWRNG